MTKNKKHIVLGLTALLGISAVAFVSNNKIKGILNKAEECNHPTLNHYTAYAPTSSEIGKNREYWICCECHKTYADAAATEEITDSFDLARKTAASAISKTDVEASDLITTINPAKVKWSDQNDNVNSPKVSTEDRMEWYSIDGKKALRFSFDYESLSEDDKARIKNGTTDPTGAASTSGTVANAGYTEVRFAITGTYETVSFDYKYYDLNADLYADGGEQAHTMAQAYDGAYNYEKLSLVNDNEWHTATVTFDKIRTITFLTLKVYHFTGELYLANMNTGKGFEVLQDFETEVCDSNATLSLSDEHVKCGQKSLKVESPVDWCRLNVVLKKDGVPLSEEKWIRYEQVKFNVYSDRSTALWVYGSRQDLVAGDNLVVMSISDWLGQVNETSYSEGKFWFQTMTGTLYLDAFRGVLKDGSDEDLTRTLFQDFEDSGIVYTGGADVSYVTDHATTGSKCAKIVTSAWTTFTVKMVNPNGTLLTVEDLNKYSSINVNINASGGCDFYFGNKAVWLNGGDNEVALPIADFITVFTTVNSPAFYDVEGCFLFQAPGGVTLYIDTLVGILA